ncbi:hypothetical protein PV761_04075 [Arthrobacter sp. CC3]|uniref:hypothetical protein n=1 Tax=Arthrobacter sp. CC3 TaxID=3029185 RepID=UPI0032679948
MRLFFFIAMALLGLVGVVFIAAATATDDTDRAVGILFFLTGLIGAAAAVMSKRKGT